MKNINIPEPCSENWNEMSPTEKGAYCQKCAFDVYDFTNKSGNEIRDILTLNIGSRVCGRIQTQQLSELNNDFSAWRVNNRHSYQRAWVFTLFVVFGMTLFSCEEDEEPVVEKFQQIGQSILTDENLSEITKTLALPAERKPEVVEKIELVPPPVEVEYNYEILGGISYDHQMPEEPPMEEVELEEVNVLEDRVYITAGMMVSSRHYDDYLEETAEVVEEKMTGLVYPNPAVNETTLKVKMPKRAKGEIQLFAMSGQMIRSIHSGRLKKGETEFQIDLTDLDTGMYLVVIYSNGVKETIKFSKI